VARLVCLASLEHTRRISGYLQIRCTGLIKYDVNGRPLHSGARIISSKNESKDDDFLRMRIKVSLTVACWLQYSEYKDVHSAYVVHRRSAAIDKSNRSTTLCCSALAC
jgi:hypothetical protein